MHYQTLLTYLFVSLLSFTKVNAQRKRVENIPKYTKEVLNFGVSIGVNNSDFIIHFSSSPIDSLLSIQSISQFGFNLAGVSELLLYENLTLRFTPGLSFNERRLQYKFKTDRHGTYTVDKRIESAYLDFPLGLKYRSKRVNNFGAYVIGGGKFSFDLQSEKLVRNFQGHELVKLDPKDWACEGGAGMDFYLPYFKFAIETKLSVGIKDILIKEANVYSSSISKLNSKVLLISFIFEG